MPLLPLASDRLCVPRLWGWWQGYLLRGPKASVPTLLSVRAHPAALTLTFELVVGERVGGGLDAKGSTL